MGCLNISVKIKQEETPSIVFKSIPITLVKHRMFPFSPSLRIKCVIACSFDSIPGGIYFAKSRLDWLNNEINIEKINTLFAKGDWSLEDLEFEDLFDD